jgi:DNA-binding CsgD family transcriptional regulator
MTAAGDRQTSPMATITSSVESYSALVGDIYDASLNPGLWPDVLRKVGEYIGGSGASLSSQETWRRSARIFFSWGADPHYLRLYEEKYHRLNPAFPTVLFFDVEEPHSIVPDCITRNEFCRSRFGREWLFPQGMIDGLFANLEKSPTVCSTLIVVRRLSEGFADEEMHRRFALVAPHVRRAVVIGNAIDLKTVEAAALADSLDTLTSGMFLVDANGRIVHANASGHQMISEASALRAPRGRLSAIDLQTDRALLDSFAAAARGDEALGRKGIALLFKARDGKRHVAHILPLTSGTRRRASASYAAAATVFVRKAELDLPSPPEAVGKEFGLTPAELRVLFAVIEVGAVAEVSHVLGVSEATVKTHLQHLFDKTGTHRQAELVKLVAGYANALFQ